jgi:kelch-like protein 2/3
VKLVREVPSSKFIIFTDSKSTLQGLEGCVDHPYIAKILFAHHQNAVRGKEVVFCWVPSHVGIPGNEKADLAAKEALNEEDFRNVPVPCTDIKQYIDSYVFKLWQSSWDSATNNKLHSLKPVLGEWKQSYRHSRRDEVVLARSRIGHSYLTHAYLLKGEEQPECVDCQSPLTVKHVLLECAELYFIRETFYSVSSLFELFDTVDPEKILSFLKEVEFYRKF